MHKIKYTVKQLLLQEAVVWVRWMRKDI